MAVATSQWTLSGGVYRRTTDSTAILAPQSATSFLRDFTHSVNPFAGCPYACQACYVKAPSFIGFRRDVLPDGRPTRDATTWGSCYELRTAAVRVIRYALEHGKLDGARLFMSPISDVYALPAEEDRLLVRGILEALRDHPTWAWILISTRSPFVVRDADILAELGAKVEVGISIPTDDEAVKDILQRKNPSIERRFEAARALRAAGIPTRIHVAPLEPHTPDFAARLADASDWVWLDWHQHREAGFGPEMAAHGWRPSTGADVAAFAADLGRRIGEGRVRIGQDHFADRWDVASGQLVQLAARVERD